MKKLISVLIIISFVFIQTFAYAANDTNTDNFTMFKSVLECSYLLYLNIYSNNDLDNHSFPSLFNAAHYDYMYKFGIVFPQNRSLNIFDPLSVIHNSFRKMIPGADIFDILNEQMTSELGEIEKNIDELGNSLYEAMLGDGELSETDKASMRQYANNIYTHLVKEIELRAKRDNAVIDDLFTGEEAEHYRLLNDDIVNEWLEEAESIKSQLESTLKVSLEDGIITGDEQQLIYDILETISRIEKELNPQDFNTSNFKANDNIDYSCYQDFFNDSLLHVTQHTTTSKKDTDVLFKNFASTLDEDMKAGELSDYNIMESKVLNVAIQHIPSLLFKDKSSFKAGFYFKDNQVIFRLLKKYSDKELLDIELLSNSHTNILMDALTFSMLIEQNKLTTYNQAKENDIEYKIYKNNKKEDLLNIEYQKEPITSDISENTYVLLYSLSCAHKPSISLSFPNITDKNRLYYHFDYDNDDPFLFLIVQSDTCNHIFTITSNNLDATEFYKYCSLFSQSLKLN